MKIAVASEKDQASAHFGHCEGFTIYEVKEEKNSNKSLHQIQDIDLDIFQCF